MARSALHLLAALPLVVLANLASAHGGGLNAQGCHNNRNTGDYHCHRPQRSAQPPADQAPRLVPGAQGSARSCGAKLYCTQMTSCEEAQFYFRQCGLSRLDGDSDGVPCEGLCR